MTKNTRRQAPWVAVLALACCGIAAALVVFLAATGRGQRGLERLQRYLFEPIVETRIETREVEVEITAPGQTVPPVRGRPEYDLRKLFNEIELAAELDLQEGRNAAVERVEGEAYRARLIMQLRRPKAATQLEQLKAQNSRIAEILPGLPLMLANAGVSPYFARIYDEKEERIRRDMLQLNRVLNRHNYFDCETILELRHPETGRRALFMLADMDVVSDGSDGDRLPEMPREITESSNYQATTSYGWSKRGNVENPLLPNLRKRLKDAETEFAIRGLTVERNRELRATIARLKPLVDELKVRSFLIAEYDPFIVLPVFAITDRSEYEYAPRVGDYAVVIHEDRILPAIVGDAGPNFKVGEASLRLGREIDSRTTPYRRPVSHLKANYIVFPGTAVRPHEPPDLAKWHQACAGLLKEIGGLGGEFSLHKWDDILKRMADEREAARRAAEEAARKTAEAAAAAEGERARQAREAADPPPANGD